MTDREQREPEVQKALALDDAILRPRKGRVQLYYEWKKWEREHGEIS